MHAQGFIDGSLCTWVKRFPCGGLWACLMYTPCICFRKRWWCVRICMLLIIHSNTTTYVWRPTSWSWNSSTILPLPSHNSGFTPICKAIPISRESLASIFSRTVSPLLSLAFTSTPAWSNWSRTNDPYVEGTMIGFDVANKWSQSYSGIQNLAPFFRRISAKMNKHRQTCTAYYAPGELVHHSQG